MRSKHRINQTGFPHRMALLEKSLIVKKSKIPGAGDGLYTRVFIPKGTRITEYTGTICTWKDVNHDEGRNGYIYYVKRYHVIDARFHEECLARYANDALGLTRVKGVNNNCEYNIEGLRVFIDAKKDIPAGTEILVDYGREYWSVIRHNNRILAKEKETAKNKTAEKKNGAAQLNGTVKKNGTTIGSGSAKKNGTPKKEIKTRPGPVRSTTSVWP